MSYYITDTPAAGRRRRGLLVTAAAGLIVLVGLAVLTWPTGGGTRPTVSPPAGPALTWAQVGDRCRRRHEPDRPASPTGSRRDSPTTNSARSWPRRTSPPGSTWMSG